MTSLSAFFLAGAISLVVNPPAAWLARRLHWESHSSRAGIQPAMSGGSVILVALVVTVAVGAGSQVFWEFQALWLGLALMFCMGLLDDIVVLTPVPKFCLQLIAASAFVASLILEERLPLGIGALLILAWLLTVSNAMNLLDNMDGLSAGVGSIAACGLAGVLQRPDGSPGEAQIILVALSGGLAGFLIYNFHPARVFLGDSGSHLMGFVLSGMAVYGWIASPPSRVGYFAPALVLVVPLADMVYVIIARIARRVPFYQGGKDHLSHRLYRLGFSTGLVAILFYLATVMACVAALWVG